MVILIVVREAVTNELKFQFNGLEMIEDDNPEVHFSNLILGEQGSQQRKCNICQEIVRWDLKNFTVWF